MNRFGQGIIFWLFITYNKRSIYKYFQNLSNVLYKSVGVKTLGLGLWRQQNRFEHPKNFPRVLFKFQLRTSNLRTVVVVVDAAVI